MWAISTSFEVQFGDAALFAGENQLYLIVILIFLLLISYLTSENIAAIVLIPEMLEDLLGWNCS